MAKKKISVVVYLDVPREASLDDVQYYVQNAVASWHGSLDPDTDPMFDLASDDIRVPRAHVKMRQKRRRRLIS